MPPARLPATSAAKIRTVEGSKVLRAPAVANLPKIAIRVPTISKMQKKSAFGAIIRYLLAPSVGSRCHRNATVGGFRGLTDGGQATAANFPVQEPPASWHHKSKNRARGERPRYRDAKSRDEGSPLHSITSSAIASTPGGMFRPSALAVLRLITSSNLVGRIDDAVIPRVKTPDFPSNLHHDLVLVDPSMKSIKVAVHA
jgi:hypothetical protein